MSALNRVEIFIEVARLQSFAKAARLFGMTGPAVSKQVMALEDELGVRLLHRTTRLVTLTEEGAHYYERARIAIEELKDAAAQIQDSKAQPRGKVRLSAPLSFGQMYLLPVLSAFAHKYPEIVLDTQLDDRKVDVLSDGYDIVIRVGVPDDSTLIYRHLADSPIYVVASPAYLKQHGLPMTPADLKNHRMIAYTYGDTAAEWRYKDPAGRTGSIKYDGAFRSNSADLMREAALEGAGIAVLPGFVVLPQLKAKKLVRILPDHETYPPREIMALMPPNRYRAAKVRLLLEWIEQACRAELAVEKI